MKFVLGKLGVGGSNGLLFSSQSGSSGKLGFGDSAPICGLESQTHTPECFKGCLAKELESRI